MKNKKAYEGDFLEIILKIALFLILLFALGFLIKRFMI